MDISNWLPMSPEKGPPLPEFLGIYWPWYKAPGAPAGEFGITLYDQYGNVIAQSGLASLAIGQVTEGSPVSAVIGLTNTSYQVINGVNTPVAATLTIKFAASTPSTTLVAQQSKSYSLTAGQIISISSSGWSALSFTPPVGTGGSVGTVTATLLDPNGVVLNTATATFNIAAAPIIYGGSISFT